MSAPPRSTSCPRRIARPEWFRSRSTSPVRFRPPLWSPSNRSSHRSSLWPAPTTLRRSPALPGETVVLYGSGFGQTDPPVTIGELATVVSPLPVANAFSATINGVKAAVAYAGLSPGSVALYQFNVTVPSTLGAGNYAVVLQYQGKSTQSGVVIAVQP